MEIHRSARKHGIDDRDIEHVVTTPLATLDETNNEGIVQVLYLGWNRAGTMLLEVVVLHFDDGRDMAIHAMKMQRRYERYLPRGEDDVRNVRNVRRRPDYRRSDRAPGRRS